MDRRTDQPRDPLGRPGLMGGTPIEPNPANNPSPTEAEMGRGLG